LGTAGLSIVAGAFAILLSVLVRSLRSSAAWSAVDRGEARAETLSELTGIFGREALQEAFGPPRLEDGIFPVSRRDVRRKRTGLGVLFGDRVLDGACAFIAIAALTPIWPVWTGRSLMEGVFAVAAAYQAAGWIASFRYLRN
jgi:hypothetical protein